MRARLVQLIIHSQKFEIFKVRQVRFELVLYFEECCGFQSTCKSNVEEESCIMIGIAMLEDGKSSAIYFFAYIN